MLFRDSQRDASELVVLSLLSESDMYGYSISKEAALRSEGRLRITPGMLYPLLRELETEGLIESRWEEVKAERSEPDDAGRKRKWYRLTAKGKRRLAQRIDAHHAYRSILDMFIADRGSPREDAR